MAPIERVKLVLQTQDLNPRIRRGEIPPYKGKLSHASVFLSPQHLLRPDHPKADWYQLLLVPDRLQDDQVLLIEQSVHAAVRGNCVRFGSCSDVFSRLAYDG